MLYLGRLYRLGGSIIENKARNSTSLTGPKKQTKNRLSYIKGVARYESVKVKGLPENSFLYFRA